MSQGRRRLAAIMFTDMVGFTALTQSDETQSLAVLERHNKLLRPIFPKFCGREVKTIGDSFLVEFDSALDAVNCAIEIQSILHEYNNSSKDEWKITLRIGVHLGDVVHKDGDVFGDAVNIASRIQPLAEPGGICVSDQVYGQVRNKVSQTMVRIEPRSLKGVKFAVDVYKVVMPWEKPVAVAVATRTAAPDSLDRKRVAVLPFTNMSSNPEEEYFADGVTEEIITSLSWVKQLMVIARTSVMGYKGTNKKVKEIAVELGVGSVLEGSVRKAGNRVRITAQLVNTSNEAHLWAQNFDRTLEDVFAIQSEIAEKVAGELKILLVGPEKAIIEKKPTENLEAYTDFLRGRELSREVSESSQRQALALFERATELDPSFARAHVGVAECHQYLAGAGYEPRDVMLPTVRASLKRALELDPDLPEVHASLSNFLGYEDDLSGCEAEARRAIELNPSLPEAFFMLYHVMAIKGDLDEMVRMAETAYRLDPIRPLYIWTLGDAYFSAGREQEALEHWKKNEHLAEAYYCRSVTDYYLTKGNIGKARELHARFEKLQPTQPWVIYMGGFIDATAGDKEKALAAVQKMEEAKMGPLAYNYMAFVYHALGDMDKYFEYMNRALEAHTIVGTRVMYSPLLAKARGDPRYKELVEKLRSQTGLAK